MKKIIFLLALLLISLKGFAQIEIPVKWNIELNDSETEIKELKFTATLEEGWHIYDMNLPQGGPVSTSFKFAKIEGAKLLDKPISSKEPEKYFDKNFEIELRWFSNTVSFIQKVEVSNPNLFKISGSIEYMACNEKNCLPPEIEEFSFSKENINIKTTLAALKNKGISTDALPKVTDEKLTAENKKTATVSPIVKTNPIKVSADNNEITDIPQLWEPVTEELKTLGDKTANIADASWFFIFISGFLYGLIAVITPCVWPMIPMTVSFFLKRTKNRKKAIRDAITYSLSIVVIYLTLGLFITGIFGANTLNDLSTNAGFNIFFFLLLLIFAISFMGAFDIVLPASWTSKLDSKADSTTGLLSIFLMSFTLVLVSFSCTGPLIGTLLVQAASIGNTIGPAAGMFGFALALSIPFGLFAIFPNLLQNMPASGGWLNSVKVVLGFLELALALKFLSVADLAYGWRILDREVFISLWIVIFALLGIYLLGKLKFSHDSDVKYISMPRFFLALASFSFAIYMIPGLWGAPLKAISAFAPPMHTQDFNLYDNTVSGHFNDYETGMTYAKKMNKPVLIDFSGHGCVNCRNMEVNVWTDPKVRSMLLNDYVVITLMVDEKKKLDEPIVIEENGKTKKLKTVGDKWSYLQRHKFGKNSQPFYVILDHEGKPIIPSYEYDTDVNKYLEFLKNGLNQFNK